MKSTKKSLFLSTISLILCFAMLLGTTYAWFTDEVTSGVNQIKAGNLDVELMHTSASVTTAASVKDQTNLFTDINGNAMLWEPGAMSYETFTVKNVGNLALKYKMAMNIADFNTLSDHSLKEVLKVKVLTGDDIKAALTRNDVAAMDWNTTDTLDAFQKDGGTLYPENNKPENGASEETFQVVVYWAPTANDNLWNVNNGQKTSDDTDALFIDFGIKLEATQLEHEYDSFDDQYDKVAWVVANADHTAKNASELQNALQEGGTVAVTKDITGNLTLNNLGDGAEVALAGTTVTGTVTAKDNVTIGGTGTITNANNGVALQVTAPGKTVTLDGASVVSGKSKAVDLSDNSKLVINSGSVERTEESGNGFNQLIFANDDAEIEIGGGDFKHESGNYATIVKFDDKGGKLDVTDGNFQAGAATGSHAKVVDLESDVVGEIKLSGGDFVIQGSHGAVVNGGKEGTTIVINGGNYKVGNVGYLVYSSTANVTVNDCTYVSDMTGATGSPKYSYIFNVSGTAKVTVKGGNYTLDKTADTVRICSSGQNANVILMGGTFNVQPSKSATIADGYKEVDNGNGTWTVVAK